MKRESIEALLKDAGVAEDKIKAAVDSVMTENGKDIEAEKSKLTAKETELTTATTTIKDLQGKIKDFDGVDIKKLQQDAVGLQAKYDTDIKAAKAAEDSLRREYTLKDSLRASGASDPDYLIFKHGGADKFTFDKEGKPIGLEDTIKPYRESLPHMFKAVTANESTVTVDSGSEHGGSGGSVDTFIAAARQAAGLPATAAAAKE